KEKLHFKLWQDKGRNEHLNKNRNLTVFQRTFLIMKLTGILLLVFSMHLSASSLAQNVTLSIHNSSLKHVFEQLHKQTGYYFIYSEDIINSAIPISLELKDVPLKASLNEIFKNQPLTYKVKENTIIINRGSNSITKSIQTDELVV